VAKAAGIAATAQIKCGNNDTTAKIMYAIFCRENGPLTKEYITLENVKGHLALLWPNA
jgi:hypothetical protein